MKTKHNVSLLNRARFKEETSLIFLNIRGKMSVRLQGEKTLLNHLYKIFVVNIADRASHDIFCRIIGFEVVKQSFTAKGANMFF